MNPQPTSTITPLALRGRIAFATLRPGGVTLDGVLEPDTNGTLDGVFSLRGALPCSTWAVAAAGLVESWAERDVPVELRFRYSKDTYQVRISDGTSLVLLDLKSAPVLRFGDRTDTSPPICA